MRQLLAHLCCLSSMALSAQTPLFTEDFEGPQPAFILNTTDVGSVQNGSNTWLLNDVYAGGGGDVICSGIPINFTIPSTPGQPAGIVPANGSYLHTAATEAVADGILCCSFASADGFCTNPGNHFTRMDQDVSTVGLSGTTFSFWWLCNGGNSIYGEVYYSTDGGSSWNLITTPIAQYRNQPTWTQQSISLAAFDGQPTLRFGFRFVNGTSLLGGQDPGFGIDDVRIEAQPQVNALVTLAVPVQLCAGQAVTIGYDAQGTYQAGNVFTAELSDATGSFAAPVAIGSVMSTTSGTIAGTIPPGTPVGAGYRVRVVSDLPAVTGSDNGTDITVALPPNAGISAQVTLCANTAAFPLLPQLGGTPDAGGVWTDPQGNVMNGMFDPQTSTPGCYTYTVSGIGFCSAASAQVCVILVQPSQAGTDFSDTVCTNDATFPLLDLLGGSPQTFGSWTGPGGAAHGPMFQVGVDALGCYIYVVPGIAPCPDDLAVVCIQAVITEPDAGQDSSIVLCANAPPYDLFQALAGTPQAGGTWTDPDATGALTGQFVDPGVLPAGDYDFGYQMPGGGGCAPDVATVSVTIDPCLGIGDVAGQQEGPAWMGQLNNGQHLFQLATEGVDPSSMMIVDLSGRSVPVGPIERLGQRRVAFHLSAAPGIYMLRTGPGPRSVVRFLHVAN